MSKVKDKPSLFSHFSTNPDREGIYREWDQQEYHRNQNCLFESENENVKRQTEAAKKSIQERIESESSLTRHRWLGAHR